MRPSGEALTNAQLVALWLETRETYARGPVILAGVMDLGSRLADALAAQPSEAKRTLLDRWNISGQPSVEWANHAVDVANANFRRAEKAEAEVKRLSGRLKTERAASDEAVGALLDAKAEIERLKASPPAPSGWQQRIAAIESPWEEHDDGEDRCFFCGQNRTQVEAYGDAHADTCLWQNAIRGTLPPAPGQNAKDALPPSSGWSAEDERKAVIAYILSCRESIHAVQVFDVMAKHIREGVHLRDALPPAPDASPAKELSPNRFDCAGCGRGIAVDEDGCCRTCGLDATPIVDGKPLWIPEQDAEADASPKEPRS